MHIQLIRKRLLETIYVQHIWKQLLSITAVSKIQIYKLLKQTKVKSTHLVGIIN